MARSRLHIVSPLPSDSFPEWVTFIDQMKSTVPACFLRIAFTEFDRQTDEVLATIEFHESGLALPDAVRKLNDNQEKWPISAVFKLISEILTQCAAASDYIDGGILSAQMVYLVDGEDEKEVKIAPFPFRGFEVSGGVPGMLQDVVGLRMEEGEDSEVRKMCEELVENARTLSCCELLSWFQSHSTVLLASLSASDPPLPTTEAEVPASQDPKECAKCKTLFSPATPMHAICDSHYLCEEDHRGFAFKRCPYCPRPPSAGSTRCSVCNALYDPIIVPEKVREGKCCSEACLSTRETEPGEVDMMGDDYFEERRAVSCLMCPAASRYHLRLRCKSHGFCGFVCQAAYYEKFPLGGLSFKSHCLKCVAYEENVAREMSSLAPRVSALADLKTRLNSSEATIDTALKLKTALCELLALCNCKIEEGKDWPYTLNPDRLDNDYYLLRCCECSRNTGVPKWSPKELSMLPDAPFLLKCEWRVHALCSSQCYTELRKTPMCKLCSDAKIQFRLKEECGEASHPTLEVIKRVPGSACVHKYETSSTLPYLSCSHEVCLKCLSNQMFDLMRTEYECSICFSLSDSEKLAKEAFS